MSVSLPIEAALAAWRKALPKNEWSAVSSWLGTFYPFQLQWLLDESRFAALVKARQIGASHTFAAWAVLRALLGELTTIVSIGEREANEVLNKVNKHARALVALGSNWANTTSKQGEVKFSTGGRVLAVPSTSAARGLSGNVEIDEFAYTGTNAPKIWDAASAAVMHGYKLRVLSTPNGANGEFHRLVTDSAQNAGWTIWRTTIDDAIAEGMRLDERELWKMARGDRRVFDQLFRCSFLNSDEMYLPPEIVEPCIQAEDDVGARHYNLRERLVYYAGLDIGLVSDLSALITIAQDRVTGHIWLVDIVTAKRTEWTRQQQIIEASEELYRWRKLHVDATGLGAVPCELLQRRFGRSRVVPVKFTTESKNTMATGLYQALADHTLTIPNDRALVSDLYALRRIVTSSGSVKFDADHDENGHADRAWALALALMVFHGQGDSRLQRFAT